MDAATMTVADEVVITDLATVFQHEVARWYCQDSATGAWRRGEVFPTGWAGDMAFEIRVWGSRGHGWLGVLRRHTYHASLAECRDAFMADITRR